MSNVTRHHVIRPTRDAIAAALGLLAAATIGIIGVWWTSTASLRETMRESLMQMATCAAAVVDGDLHSTIRSSQQMDDADYRRCIAPLQAIYARVTGVKYMYTVVLDGDAVRFVLDTAADGDADGDGLEDRSEAWSIYEEASQEMRRALRQGKPTADAMPYTDQWGTFISGYAPIRDSADGTVGVLGVDVDAGYYLSRVTAAERWALLGVVPAVLVSILAGIGVHRARSSALHDAEERSRYEQVLREDENRLKAIVDAIQAGVILIDRRTHRVVDANTTALTMFGAAREDVIGQPCHKFICPADCGSCPVTDLGQSVDRSERIMLTADGREIPVIKTVVTVNLQQQEYLLESFIDISDRKKIEQELTTHRERLEELVQERTRKLLDAERQMLQGEKLASVGRLAAGVAHEINTPIQFIGDNLRALSDELEDLMAMSDEYKELVKLVKAGAPVADKVVAIEQAEIDRDLAYIIEDAPKAISQGLEGVARVADIVRAMKDFSHMDRGEVTSVDINHSLESTLTIARNEYKYVADVETDFGELPMVACYASEMNQVFLNLLVNAAHAISDTKQRGKITVRTRSLGQQVEITIADTGTGIPESVRNKVFDPFFTTKEVGKGTGQGLSLAHAIVVGKHGGTLSFETEAGKGTTFFVHLPLRIPEKAAIDEGGRPA